MALFTWLTWRHKVVSYLMKIGDVEEGDHIDCFWQDGQLTNNQQEFSVLPPSSSSSECIFLPEFSTFFQVFLLLIFSLPLHFWQPTYSLIISKGMFCFPLNYLLLPKFFFHVFYFGSSFFLCLFWLPDYSLIIKRLVLFSAPLPSSAPFLLIPLTLLSSFTVSLVSKSSISQFFSSLFSSFFIFCFQFILLPVFTSFPFYSLSQLPPLHPFLFQLCLGGFESFSLQNLSCPHNSRTPKTTEWIVYRSCFVVLLVCTYYYCL